MSELQIDKKINELKELLKKNRKVNFVYFTCDKDDPEVFVEIEKMAEYHLVKLKLKKHNRELKINDMERFFNWLNKIVLNFEEWRWQ